MKYCVEMSNYLNTSYPLQGVGYDIAMEPTNNSLATLDAEFFPLLRHPVYMIVIYSLAYTTIMIIALVGNAMVVAVVARNRTMHTVINYFIVNLAIADIMVALICLPMTLLSNLYHGKSEPNMYLTSQSVIFILYFKT